MQLYLVERTDKWSYDDFDKFVCWAKSSDEAKKLHPYGDETYTWEEDGWHSRGSKATYHSWADKLEDVKVWELSRPPEKPTVVLASYNAE